MKSHENSNLHVGRPLGQSTINFKNHYVYQLRVSFGFAENFQLQMLRSQEERSKVLSRRSSMSDIPSNLPSVKELATKFLKTKSPEPLPRKKV